MASSKLLAIPGELRNRIYEAVLSYNRPAGEKKTPHLRREQKLLGVSKSNDETDWAALARQAYGLTQTSTLVRKEFLPLYRQRVEVRIDIRDLASYVNDVILSPQIDTAPACGNIGIDVKYTCSVDLRDVLLLHNRAPDLRLRFSHQEGDSDMMSILLDAHRWPSFHAYVSERTYHLELSIYIDDALVICGHGEDSDDPELPEDPPPLTWPYAYDPGCWVSVKGLLYVKEEFAEPWMYSAENWSENLAKWEKKLGLGASMSRGYSFRPHVSAKAKSSGRSESSG